MPACKSTPDKYDSSVRIIPCVDDWIDNIYTADKTRIRTRKIIPISRGFYLHRKHAHATPTRSENEITTWEITKFKIMYGEVVPVKHKHTLGDKFCQKDRIKYSEVSTEEHDEIIKMLEHYWGTAFVPIYVE
jgi:hypothetical protein